MTKPLYEIFTGEDLKIAEKIQQRRYQMVVHSYLYYELDMNIVEDNVWAKWGKELQDLQELYPNIADKVRWSKDFIGWDASTGAFLPFTDDIKLIAKNLLANRTISKPVKNNKQGRLF